MDLYMVRHGIAIDREDPKCPSEAERYLTEPGIKKTKQVASGVAELGVTPDVMISSPFVRAMQTAEIFAVALKYSKAKIRKSDVLLPGADAQGFFRELAKLKDAGVVMCFGHAPNVDELIAAGVGARHMITSLKKAGVAFLEMKRLAPPQGHLVWVGTPRILKMRK